MNLCYSTSKNISENKLSIFPKNIVNKYITYPDLTDNRKTEGGFRTKNKYKHSLKNKPLVTIITVVYNEEEFLERAILSVLNQTYDNIEYIIIDGGSTDSTLSIIEKYEDYIDYYVSESDKGIFDAMNKGLTLASGDYIAILNSDDFYYDFAVKSSVDLVLSSNADIIAANADIIDEHENIIRIQKASNFDDVAFLVTLPACHQTMFIEKKIYNKIGYYDTSFKIAGDLDLVFKIIDLSPKYELIRYSTVAFTLGGASNSNLDASNKEHVKVMSKRLKDMNIKELESLYKFVANWLSEYTFDFVYSVILKYNFTDNQKKILYRRVLEENPKKCIDIFKLKENNEYSTIKNISENKLNIFPNNIVNKYIIYPDLTNNRKSEGGLRCQNKYKHGSENKPLVTIIMTVYNGDKFLERSILSVLNQTYDNIEYIIIDGGSTDSTLSIIKKYEEYIDYYISEPHEGVYDAINKGLTLASGDYITILNSDDFYFTNSIEECVSEVLVDNKIDYIARGIIKIDDDYIIKEKHIPSKITESTIFNYNIATKEVYFIKSSCYNSIACYYDLAYKQASDYKFKLDLIANNFKYFIDDSPLLFSNGDIFDENSKESYLEEVYSIAMKNNKIYSKYDIKDLITTVSESELINNFEEKLKRMNIKYNTTPSLYYELLCIHYKKLLSYNTSNKKQKIPLKERIFSIKKTRYFNVFYILGIKISVKK